MSDIEFPFVYAGNSKIIKEQLPNSYFVSKDIHYINYNSIHLFEFQNDCGCIYITNLHYLTDKLYKGIENFASLNGYSKILCTLSEEYHSQKDKIKLLKDNDFIIIETGFSNRSRSSEEDDYNFQTWLCFKVIKPQIQGYV